MKDNNLQKVLMHIANKCFCCYTYDRAYDEWKKIKPQLSKEHQDNINELIIQIGNPDISPNGYGKSYWPRYQKACIDLKKYIENNF